ncbi:MAG: glycosyltransferase [Calditrichaceae bacterium]|nr:glycosyltransferase [Calditrichaceae bacterium]
MLIKRKNKLVDPYFIGKIQFIECPFTNIFFYLFFLVFWTIKERQKFDVIITGPGIVNFATYFISVFTKKKWVIDIWDIPFRDMKKTTISKVKNKIEIEILKRILKRADLYITSIIVHYELEQLKLDPKKIRKYKNAIYLQEIPLLKPRLSHNEFILLVQRSSFDGEYGLNLIIDTFKLVSKYINSRLYIIGRINQHVVKDTLDRKIKDHIIFTGFIDHTEVMQYIANAHVCIIPYPQIVDLQQIYPIKVIEYLAMSKAIVYSNVEGVVEQIGGAGILVDPPTANNFAKSIIFLYKNPDKRKKLEKLAKKRSKEFDEYKKNEQIFNEIKAVIK